MKDNRSAQNPREGSTPFQTLSAILGPLAVILDLLGFHKRVKNESTNQKTYFAKNDGSAQKPRGTPIYRPHQPFWGPIAAILDFYVLIQGSFLIEGVLESKTLRIYRKGALQSLGVQVKWSTRTNVSHYFCLYFLLPNKKFVLCGLLFS